MLGRETTKKNPTPEEEYGSFYEPSQKYQGHSTLGLPGRLLGLSGSSASSLSP
jgi:hypothetical protein